jgi:ATP-dependent Lon protease
VDHYVEVEYDLSDVMFVATSNTLQIPGPLLDRMELIRLSGYTEEEKLAIARQYLVPKQLKSNGLGTSDVVFTGAAIKELVRFYTREAGVRSLEREVGSVLRKAARQHLERHHKGVTTVDADELAEGQKARADDAAEVAALEAANPAMRREPREEKPVAATKADEKPTKKSAKGDAAAAPKAEGIIELRIHETITEKSIQKALGARRFRIGLGNTQHEIGLCTGLAWTEVGGDLLVAEVSILPGKGKLTCTGKLGEVMQESAQAALSYVRARAKFLNLDEDFYQKLDIHIHVPEGAIPKDGPSAGIAMATALTSALTMRPVSKDVAMTGEITLRGRVLPIGGLKEKIIAAHRAGIKKVLIPKENEKDLADIPKAVMKDIQAVPVEHMDTVLMHALVWKQPGDDVKEQDELFEKLKKITETEVQTAGLSFAH